MTRALLEVGLVAKPHGLCGELKVRLHWEPSDTLLAVDSVFLTTADQPARALQIERVRRMNRFMLVKLQGVDDVDAAQRWRGAVVAVERAAVPALGEGEYYLCDLVGAQVVAPDGPLGTVIEVRTYPTVDVMVIRTTTGKLVEQPLGEDWIESVDTAQRRVRLTTAAAIIE